MSGRVTREAFVVMPAVHHARRLVAERRAGNPFVTAGVLEECIGELSRLYLSCSKPLLADRLKVALDALEMEAA